MELTKGRFDKINLRSAAQALALLFIAGCDAVEAPDGDIANSQQTQVSEVQDHTNLTSSSTISMELKTQLNDRGTEFGSSLRFWESNHLMNSGDESIKLKWVLVNNRDECFTVPVITGQDRQAYLTVVDEDDTYNVVDYVDLKVGQSIHLDTTGTSCGEIIRLKVGTTSGEFDLETSR